MAAGRGAMVRGACLGLVPRLGEEGEEARPTQPPKQRLSRRRSSSRCRLIVLFSATVMAPRLCWYPSSVPVSAFSKDLYAAAMSASCFENWRVKGCLARMASASAPLTAFAVRKASSAVVTDLPSSEVLPLDCACWVGSRSGGHLV